MELGVRAGGDMSPLRVCPQPVHPTDEARFVVRSHDVEHMLDDVAGVLGGTLIAHEALGFAQMTGIVVVLAATYLSSKAAKNRTQR